MEQRSLSAAANRRCAGAPGIDGRVLLGTTALGLIMSFPSNEERPVNRRDRAAEGRADGAHVRNDAASILHHDNVDRLGPSIALKLVDRAHANQRRDGRRLYTAVPSALNTKPKATERQCPRDPNPHGWRCAASDPRHGGCTRPVGLLVTPRPSQESILQVWCIRIHETLASGTSSRGARAADPQPRPGLHPLRPIWQRPVDATGTTDIPIPVHCHDARLGGTGGARRDWV